MLRPRVGMCFLATLLIAVDALAQFPPPPMVQDPNFTRMLRLSQDTNNLNRAPQIATEPLIKPVAPLPKPIQLTTLDSPPVHALAVLYNVAGEVHGDQDRIERLREEAAIELRIMSEMAASIYYKGLQAIVFLRAGSPTDDRKVREYASHVKRYGKLLDEIEEARANLAQAYKPGTVAARPVASAKGSAPAAAGPVAAATPAAPAAGRREAIAPMIRVLTQDTQDPVSPLQTTLRGQAAVSAMPAQPASPSCFKEESYLTIEKVIKTVGFRPDGTSIREGRDDVVRHTRKVPC